MKITLSNIFEQDEEDDKNILTSLLQFARDEIKSWELEDADPFIKDIIVKYPRGASKVTFNFKNDYEVAELLDISDEDIHMLHSLGYGYEFTDDYNITQDLKDGYGNFWFSFNQDNIKLLKKISEYLIPEHEFNLDDEKFNKKLYEILDGDFDSELENMIYEYVEQINQYNEEKTTEAIDKELDEMLDGTGFSVGRDLEKINTTVGNLIYAIREMDYEGNLEGLVKQILEGRGRSVGGWYDLTHQFYDIYDNERYQLDINRYLEKIWDKISEDENLEKLLKTRENIKKKYPLNTWITIPKDKTAKLKIKGFKGDQIVVVITSTEGKFETFEKSLSEENFYNLLYQLELFDLNT